MTTPTFLKQSSDLLKFCTLRLRDLSSLLTKCPFRAGRHIWSADIWLLKLQIGAARTLSRKPIGGLTFHKSTHYFAEVLNISLFIEYWKVLIHLQIFIFGGDLLQIGGSRTLNRSQLEVSCFTKAPTSQIEFFAQTLSILSSSLNIGKYVLSICT